MTDEITLYGAPYSVYVRAVRLTLLEKNTPYRIESIDIFAKETLPQSYRELHPFLKIPALRHGTFTLHETGAILRYLEEIFPEPALIPAKLKGRAEMNRLLSVADNYAYASMVWGIYVPLRDQEEAVRGTPEFAKAVEQTQTVLTVMQSILNEGTPYLCGDRISLADIQMVPIFYYFTESDIGLQMLSDYGQVNTWWDAMRKRDGYHAILSER